jgi:hypothetical protein
MVNALNGQNGKRTKWQTTIEIYITMHRTGTPLKPGVSELGCSRTGVPRITEITKFYRNHRIFTEITLDITEITIRSS